MTTFRTSDDRGAPAASAAISFARPDRRLDYHVPLGLCEDYAADNRRMEIVRRDLEVCRATGLRVLRVSFPWESIEPRRGQYELAFWDELIRTAVVDHGITLIPYVCYGPQWACGGDARTCRKLPPRRVEDFEKIMTVLAARYRDEISTWELWNEPDNKDFWTGSAGDYAQLLEAGSRGVRAGNSAARVVFGGIAHDLDFLERVMVEHDGGRHVDVVNIHNYYETWEPRAVEEITRYVNRAADIIAKCGQGQPLWMAEVGYSSHRRGSKVSDFCRAHYDYEHTRMYQAVQLVKTLTLLLSTEQLSLIAWYEIKDLPPATEVIGDQNHRHLGIRGVNYEMKPAGLALGFFDRLFGRKSRCIDDAVEVQTFRGERPEVHAFSLADGGSVVVAWLRTDGAAVEAGEGGGVVVDERRTDFEVWLPGRLAGQVMQYDAVGRATGCGLARPGAESTRLCDLHLKGGEVLVVRVEAERAG